ncbi:hypothetical protein COM99_26490 [Bacillus cereus]|uniref:hypothetical protein n=1 Tax=Bacillus cereus TaxID=1396 RepID=UPI000BED6A24|nr:hypothetical protein [Bacillus cereus]MDF3554651.1 hypothetical protein [Bacillus cereus]PEC30707.1 hypothetical protein COM99_26490 [Bacillus cereus]
MGNLNNNNSMSIIAAEAVILEILEHHIHTQGKDIKTNFLIYNKSMKRRTEIDGFASQGFDEFVGATAIEIKLYRNSKSIKSKLNDILQRYCSINSFEDTPIIDNLLIIITTPLTKEEKELLESAYDDLPFKYSIWDSSDLQLLFNKYPELINEMETNPSKVFVKQLFKAGLNSSRDEWKVKRECMLSNTIVYLLL